MLHTSDFDFELPSELIASHPLARRDASRMLVVEPAADTPAPRPLDSDGQDHPGTSCHPSAEGNLDRAGHEPSSPPLEGCPQGGVVRDIVNYKTLAYNPKLVGCARALRKSGSLPEALLWKELRNKQLNGLDFERQKVIGNFIVDFFCAAQFLVIEIDDMATHDNKGKYDATCDEYLKSLGLNVIHIPAKDVLKDASAVAEYIKTALGEPTRHHVAACAGIIDRFPSGKRGGGAADGVSVSDKHIRDFLDYIRPGDVVVFNNSRVIPARFMAGGHEITLHTSAGDDKTWWGLCKKFTKIPIGTRLTLDDGTECEVLARDEDSGLKLRFHCDNVFSVLDAVGKMPLPPYMKRDQEDSDRERYQTVYADPIGSMAAPTAGLHFTPELLDGIRARGAEIVNITLHVGAGTWMPVKTEDLSAHKMHSEWCCITPAQADIINNANRVIAVGTTSMRTLESAAMDNRKMPVGARNKRIQPICRATDIFITPGYEFGAVDVLLTNFHLPKSTLFMLVSAFAGLENMQAAYRHAVVERYRFFSYGDCCLLFKNASGN